MLLLDIGRHLKGGSGSQRLQFTVETLVFQPSIIIYSFIIHPRERTLRYEEKEDEAVHRKENK